jgi:endonuclease/exonuclease/phosphatase family metal-dependent hydrolase
MTYNIQHGNGNMMKADLDGIAEIISRSRAKIIGLNEVDSNMLRSNFQKQYKILGKKLEMSYVFGPALEKIVGKYGNTLLTTFPIKDVKNYNLPVKSGREPRSLLEVELEPSPNKDILVMVTHLSTEDSSRKKQLEWIKNYIKNIDQSFILMGDLNSNVNAISGYKSLSQNIKTYPSDNPSSTIDHFFTNLGNSQNPDIIESKISDHFPLVAEFKTQSNS